MSLPASPASAPASAPSATGHTRSTTSTVETAHAATTPFVKSPKCSSRFITTSFIHTVGHATFSTTTRVTLFVSDLGNGECKNDQPDGQSWSPAVCPQSWTAWNLQPWVVNDYPDAENLSTAFCCASGYSPQTNDAYYGEDTDLDKLVNSWKQVCTSGGGGTIELVDGQHVTHTFSGFDHVGIHEGLRIEWRQSDTSTLTPAPPALGLCTTAILKSWAPGMPVDPTLAAMGACRERVAIAGWGETVYALVIALPVLGLCLIAGSSTWFWCRRARRSRVARAAPVQLLVGGEKRIQDANQQ